MAAAAAWASATVEVGTTAIAPLARAWVMVVLAQNVDDDGHAAAELLFGSQAG